MMNKAQDTSNNVSWAIGYVFFYTILFFLTKVLFVYSNIPLLLMMHDKQLTTNEAQDTSSTQWGRQWQQQKVLEKAQNSSRHI